MASSEYRQVMGMVYDLRIKLQECEGMRREITKHQWVNVLWPRYTRGLDLNFWVEQVIELHRNLMDFQQALHEEGAD